MIEKLRPVGNPLSIIAIFAALAEVAGTAVLVVVNVEIQKVFVWFVMGFPTVLILAFFATLNFNRAALYAPRDYNNDDTFLELMSRRARIQSELAAARRIASDLLKEIPLEAPAAENHAVGPEQAASESSEADAGHKPTLARLKALAGHLDSAADTAVVIEEWQRWWPGDMAMPVDLKRRNILRIVLKAQPRRLSARQIAAEMHSSFKSVIVLLSSMKEEGLLSNHGGYATTDKGKEFLSQFQYVSGGS